MDMVYYYFLKFFIYSVIGYISEVLYVYFNSKKIVNRGFLYGPYIPIYGVGCLMINFLLIGYYNDSIVVFIMSFVICSILEYFTSYLMEKVFKTRWWDYSYYKYNINGRVCLKNSILFGFGGIATIYILDPAINLFLASIDNSVKIKASILLMIIICIDITLSTFEAVRISNISNHLDAIMDEYTINKNIKLNKIRMRLFMAFPYLVNSDKVINRLKKLKKDFSKKQ